MGTTALVAELLVGGVQTLLTVGVLFIAVSSRPHLSDWSAVLRLQWAPAGVVAIVVAYTLGILVDRVTDSLLSPLDMKMRHRVIKKKSFSVPRARLFVM